MSSEVYNQIPWEAKSEFSILQGFDFNRSGITEQVQQEAEEELQEIPDILSDSSSNDLSLEG